MWIQIVQDIRLTGRLRGLWQWIWFEQITSFLPSFNLDTCGSMAHSPLAHWNDALPKRKPNASPRSKVVPCKTSHYWYYSESSLAGWLVVLMFNATLVAKFISWRSVTHMCFLAFSYRYQHNFLSKATDYFFHMLQQRREAKIRRESLQLVSL